MKFLILLSILSFIILGIDSIWLLIIFHLDVLNLSLISRLLALDFEVDELTLISHDQTLFVFLYDLKHPFQLI